MASRILGMGDVLSLVEKAQENFDLENAKKMEEKLRRNDFTLDDFLDQMQQVKKLGSLSNILGMIPGDGRTQKKSLAIRKLTSTARRCAGSRRSFEQ